jgi:hypothetical protein
MTKEWEEAFHTFQTSFIQGPVLITPDWTHLFYVHVDASNMAIGVVLTQNQNGKLINPPIIQVNCWTW